MKLQKMNFFELLFGSFGRFYYENYHKTKRVFTNLNRFVPAERLPRPLFRSRPKNGSKQMDCL